MMVLKGPANVSHEISQKFGVKFCEVHFFYLCSNKMALTSGKYTEKIEISVGENLHKEFPSQWVQMLKY